MLALPNSVLDFISTKGPKGACTRLHNNASLLPKDHNHHNYSQTNHHVEIKITYFSEAHSKLSHCKLESILNVRKTSVILDHGCKEKIQKATTLFSSQYFLKSLLLYQKNVGQQHSVLQQPYYSAGKKKIK